MQFSKHIVVLDVETTGLDKKNDRIIQISALKIDSETFDRVGEFNYYIIPSGDFEITPEAQEVHGISEDFLRKEGTSLKSVYDEFVEFIGDCDILTYNGLSFDIPIIYNDFSREGLDPQILNHNNIDALAIERLIHSNKLEDVYKRYTGLQPTDAHDSLYDCNMTAVVFERQTKIADESVEFYSKASLPESILDINEDGQIVMTGGKHSGKLLSEVLKADRKYFIWLYTNVMTVGTQKLVIEKFKNQ